MKNLGSEPLGVCLQSPSLVPSQQVSGQGLGRHLLSEEMEEATDGLLARAPAAGQLCVFGQLRLSKCS